MQSALVRVLRGSTVESVHRASLVATDSKGRLVARCGDPRLVTFLRSTAKPMQQLALLETGTAERFRFTDADLALSVGSHNGDERHTQGVQSILDRIGLGPQHLQCGAHAPYGKAAAQRVGSAFSALHHNCSGKHAAMLAVCVHTGWDASSYLQPDHPLQQLILRNVAQETGLQPADVAVAIDGCGVPSFAVPLRNAARAFARLTAPESIRGERGRSLQRIRRAMMDHPDLVAGEDRVDTQLMRALPGRIWVKAGAEAFYAMGLVGPGVGVAIKVEDGASRAIAPLLMSTLEQFGLADEALRRRLEPVWNEPVRTVTGRPVGRIECDLQLLWPRRTAPRVTA